MLQGSPARQSLALPPLVLTICLANSLGGKAEEQINDRTKEKKKISSSKCYPDDFRKIGEQYF